LAQEDAESFAASRDALAEAWESQREAQKRAKMAKREVEDIEDEGGSVPPDIMTRLD
jgi:hypothetical protein